ncbi:hypothetical protein [Spirillospora sp. NPDC047279]|uniref:hypothetical protein n=1 Tax=Spirillospora sp. NPDC047279 TaxID=3155478 RepID=UPI0033DA68DE
MAARAPRVAKLTASAATATALSVLGGMVLVAGPAVGAESRSGRAPTWCKAPGPLDSRALPSRISLSECDLRDRVIEGLNGASVQVPARGSDTSAVTAHVLQAHGASALSVRIDAGGRTLTISEHSQKHLDGRPRRPAAPQDACQDTAWAAHGLGSWPRGSTIPWRFFQGPDIDGVADERAVVTAGVERAVTATTDCRPGGRFTPAPNIHHRFDGTTSAAPNTDGGMCTARDGTNSFGWVDMGSVERDTLAVSCTWQSWRATVEGDIALQSHGKAWWTPREPRSEGGTAIPGCPAGSFEPTSAVVHEMLHVLGLQHVSGQSHAALTMAPSINSCDDRAATLGLGDYQGLMELYGTAGA